VFRELLRVRRERKKEKFVFKTQEILELVEEAEVDASKKKAKKTRIMKVTTSEIDDEEEEDIGENVLKSESDCIIVASGRLISK
jgi:hypothetical protein